MMKNICQSLNKHTGLWSRVPAQPVLSANAGTFSPSIRQSYSNDEGMSGSFIEGSGYC